MMEYHDVACEMNGSIMSWNTTYIRRLITVRWKDILREYMGERVLLEEESVFIF